MVYFIFVFFFYGAFSLDTQGKTTVFPGKILQKGKTMFSFRDFRHHKKWCFRGKPRGKTWFFPQLYKKRLYARTKIL